MLRRRVYNFLRFNYQKRSVCLESYYNDSPNNPKFSEDQKNLILDVLNNANPDELLNTYSVPKLGIKNLQKWLTNNGSLQSVDDALDVEGFSVKLLQKICSLDILEEPNCEQDAKALLNGRKFTTPTFNKKLEVKSAVGIYAAMNGLSWSKINTKNNSLDSWGLVDFSKVPTNLPMHETFSLALNVLNEIPPADVYVFEGSDRKNSRLSNVKAYLSFIDFGSILYALLKTSPRHQLRPQIELETVYHLKPFLFAKIFQIFVGKEIVSTEAVMKQILTNINLNDNLNYTPIHIEEPLQEYYRTQTFNDKESISRSLLLTNTFLDLCVYNNQSVLRQAFEKYSRKSQSDAEVEAQSVEN